MENKKINLDISEQCEKLKKTLDNKNLPKELSDLSNKVLNNCSNIQNKLTDISETITKIQSKSQDGGKKSKKIRRHIGIHQIGGRAGKLKKGFYYTGKKTKKGLPIIKKSKKKNNNQKGGGIHPPPPFPPYPPHPYPYPPYPYPPHPYPVIKKTQK